MKLAIKLSASFWLLVASTVLLSCTHPVYAAPQVSTIECTGFRVTMTQTHKANPLSAVVSFEKGVFVEVPSDRKEFIQFYNLDTGEILKFATNYQNRLFMSLYKSVDFYNAHKPYRELLCNG